MAKLENFNPAGSVKERIAKAALDHSLEPDWTITLRTEEEKNRADRA